MKIHGVPSAASRPVPRAGAHFLHLLICDGLCCLDGFILLLLNDQFGPFTKGLISEEESGDHHDLP